MSAVSRFDTFLMLKVPENPLFYHPGTYFSLWDLHFISFSIFFLDLSCQKVPEVQMSPFPGTFPVFTAQNSQRQKKKSTSEVKTNF